MLHSSLSQNSMHISNSLLIRTATCAINAHTYDAIPGSAALLYGLVMASIVT